ncbi:MAG: hypothetical protein R3B54_17180 [Bdellovibrionota bacterium]
MLASGDLGFRDTYEKALRYYSENFFTAEGAPKWRSHREFPQDIHGAAQGILTFCKAEKLSPGHLEFAERILCWTLDNSESSR